MDSISALLARRFQLQERGTSVATEFRGALATFLTMAYILFANPAILAAANVPRDSAVACTAVASGVCCLLMGWFSNLPVAVASGMGLNAFVAFTVARATGSWQTAMGLVVLDGLIILVLVLLGLREAVLRAIPRDLRLAIGAGIGLFIAFIGLVNARLVIVPAGTLAVLAQNPREVLPPVTYGSITDPVTATALGGLLITAVLMARQVKGALVIGIAITTVIALLAKVAQLPATFAPPSFEAAFKADVLGALRPEHLALLLSLVMVDFFDTLGTATAVTDQAGLTREDGSIPNAREMLVVDSVSASIGGLMGASSVTAYIESASGVAEGARTGLHTLFVGLFFLVATLAAPLAGMVPAAATAPALILVGFLMLGEIRRIDFNERDTAIPVFVTLITLPTTYSITHGIGFGFLTFVAIKVLTGKAREVHPLMIVSAAAFGAYFIWGIG